MIKANTTSPILAVPERRRFIHELRELYEFDELICDAGNAENAEDAENAENAENAEDAENAVNAENAENAEDAENAEVANLFSQPLALTPTPAPFSLPLRSRFISRCCACLLQHIWRRQVRPR